MCGRIVQASGPLRYAFVDGLDVNETRFGNLPRRYNGAPSQAILVIRQNQKTGERSLDPLAWGFVPNWTREEKPRTRPINAKGETVARVGLFREAFERRRCIVPVDAFFEWQATKRGRQPYAIGMQDGAPFGLAGIWDNWKDPKTGEWTRTFAIITVPANELVGTIHDRMPAILRPDDYELWLSDVPDASLALRPFPADKMCMWPVSTRVNSAQNDDALLIEPVVLESAVS